MEKEKYVDEGWKESAAKEKEKLENTVKESMDQADEAPNDSKKDIENNNSQQNKNDGHVDQEEVITVNFMNYVASLGFQAMIFLGETPNPITNETEKNLDQAKFLIDTLVMLREKTKGNLNQQETQLLDTYIYELQMKFVEISQKDQAK